MARAKILIVEDEGIVALDLRNRLRRLGYAILPVAASGEEAIQIATAMHPDLVLMDIRLKGKMNGIQAAAKIQARFDIPVVYLTALADRDTLQRAQTAKHSGYVTKPFEEGELQAVIEAALG